MNDSTASALAEALHDRYAIERELGRGGMATVYLVRDLKHDRLVALKVLRTELAATLGPERFQREIRLAARLQHPHILSVHDSGEAVGRLWFTMPYVEGESLRTRLSREGQLPIDAAVRIAREAAQALQYAHDHGVIHRDIKPENLLLTRDGNTLVADFGIARALEASGAADERLTQTGLSLGTPRYMSPEQATADRAIDARTDIYSLGCVLYEMFAGHPPFLGTTPQEILARQVLDPAPPLRVARGTVPEAVERSVMKALAKAPADRFATMTQFAEALAPSVAAPQPTAAVARRPGRRVLVGLATLGVGLVLAGGVLFASRRSRQAGGVVRPEHLAVLPFENQGDSADAYFADGVTDELRGKLAALPGLEVVASRSSNDYRHTSKSLPEIARELQVDYLLIGKIRWEKGASGTGRVRVSPELIKVVRGASPITKWEQPFDASLTDVFQVQADIANQVAQALDIALGAGVPEALATRPTTSTEAYDDYLRANEYFERQTVPDMQLAVQLYHQALEVDSNFVLAWARVARADAFLYWFRADFSAQHLERVDQEARHALALAPDLPEAHEAMGYYHFWGDGDLARALDEFRIAGRHDPNNAEVADVVGLILRRQGNWDPAIASLTRATALDPRSYNYLEDLGETYLVMRLYPKAEGALVRSVAVGPDSPFGYDLLMRLYLNRDGSLEKSRRVAQSALSRMAFGRLFGLGYQPLGFQAMYSLIAADDAYQAQVASFTPASTNGDTLGYFAFKAAVYRRRGERARASAYDDSTRATAVARIARHQDDLFTHTTLAVADGYLGRGREAIAEGKRAVAMMPLSKNAFFGAAGPMALAEVYTTLGDTDDALNQLEILLAVPSFVSAELLRADPTWAVLRGNPRFERLVASQ